MYICAGVLNASRRRLVRKQLKVYGVDIKAADLEKFLKDEIGFAQLLDEKDASTADQGIIDQAVEAANAVVNKVTG